MITSAQQKHPSSLFKAGMISQNAVDQASRQAILVSRKCIHLHLAAGNLVKELPNYLQYSLFF